MCLTIVLGVSHCRKRFLAMLASAVALRLELQQGRPHRESRTFSQRAAVSCSGVKTPTTIVSQTIRHPL